MSLLNKELLAPREMTSKEVSDLVAEFVQSGGTIKVYPASAALNFRADASVPGENQNEPKLKRPRKTGKKKK